MRTLWLALALVLAAAAPALSGAQDEGPTATHSVSGYVVDVDVADRTLDVDGETFRVPEQVPNLAQLGRGDHVSVFYFDDGDDHVAVLLEVTPKRGS